jgi:hypothetical protein
MTREVMQQALEALESGLAFDAHSTVLQNLRKALAQPVQEPVHSVQSNGKHSPLLTHMMNRRTATPQREWVGLTDEDKQTAVWTNGTFGGGALWAEARLKELNHG